MITEKQVRAIHGTASWRRLTRREKDVVVAVCVSDTHQEAARSLFVTDKTIKFHLTSIYKKLKISGRVPLYKLVLTFVWIEKIFEVHPFNVKNPSEIKLTKGSAS